MSRKKRQRAGALQEINRLAQGQPMALGMMQGTSRMAGTARFAGWRPPLRDADSEAQYELKDLRAFSSDLVRTAPVASGAIQNRVSYIVGTGLSLQSRIDVDELGIGDDQASDWQSLVERRFRLWAGSPFADAMGEQCFYELQDLVMRSHDARGDVFVLLARKRRNGWPFQLVLQVIEADRVCNPDNSMNTATMVEGVERGADGEPVAIHVAKHHPGRVIPGGKNEWTHIPIYGSGGRRNVLHLKKMDRPGQTRGMPLLAPIIATIKQLTRYSDAEVDAAVNSAAMALFATMDSEAFNDILSDDERAQIMKSASAWDGNLDSGKVINLMPGENIVSPTPGRPNPNFEPFFGAMASLLAMGLNMPKEVLLKAFNSSYSASRAALMDAWRTWKIERAWLTRRLCQPVYEEWLADAVAAGIIQAAGFFADPFVRAAWCGSNWSGDGPGALDPKKEAEAIELRTKSGVTTLAEETVAYDGGDWEAKHRQRVREVADRRAGQLEAEPAPAAPATTPPSDDDDDSDTD